MFANDFLIEVSKTVDALNIIDIDRLARSIAGIKGDGGRLFVLGVGGSAGNASHAVNDFRKLDNIEAYCPTDNVSELTARMNDEGWTSIFYKWLLTSNLNSKDGLLILSVGGGSIERNISTNLVYAAKFAKVRDAKVFSILGRDNGDVLEFTDIAVIIPVGNKELLTPISEAIQSVILHLIVSYDFLKEAETTW